MERAEHFTGAGLLGTPDFVDINPLLFTMLDFLVLCKFSMTSKFWSVNAWSYFESLDENIFDAYSAIIPAGEHVDKLMQPVLAKLMETKMKNLKKIEFNFDWWWASEGIRAFDLSNLHSCCALGHQLTSVAICRAGTVDYTDSLLSSLGPNLKSLALNNIWLTPMTVKILENAPFRLALINLAKSGFRQGEHSEEEISVSTIRLIHAPCLSECKSLTWFAGGTPHWSFYFAPHRELEDIKRVPKTQGLYFNCCTEATTQFFPLPQLAHLQHLDLWRLPQFLLPSTRSMFDKSWIGIDSFKEIVKILSPLCCQRLKLQNIRFQGRDLLAVLLREIKAAPESERVLDEVVQLTGLNFEFYAKEWASVPKLAGAIHPAIVSMNNPSSAYLNWLYSRGYYNLTVLSQRERSEAVKFAITSHIILQWILERQHVAACLFPTGPKGLFRSISLVSRNFVDAKRAFQQHLDVLHRLGADLSLFLETTPRFKH